MSEAALLQIDHGVTLEPRQRELGRSVGRSLIYQRDLTRAGDVRLAVAVRTAHANPKTFDIAPSVVEEVQPGARAISDQTSDHDLAAKNPKAPLIVCQLTPNLLRERARVGRFFLRILRTANPDVDPETRIGRLYRPEKEIAA